MKYGTLLLPVFAAGVLFFTGCASTGAVTGTYEGPKGMNITIYGDSCTVSLEANATTGYSWEYELSDPEVLTCTGSEYKENRHKKGMVGTGGRQYYTFKAGKQGSTVIVFDYAQRWNGGNQGDRIMVNAAVSPAGTIVFASND
jgi:Predicted secreted protein